MKNIINNAIEESLNEIKDIRDLLYENPEIGGEEEKSSKLLVDFLRKNSFEVEEDYYNFKYAFRGVYDSNKEGSTIGLFAEYDALPEIGHGCGHNLISTTTLAAAIGIKSIIDKTGGKLIVYGTPGEENLQSKTILVEKGAFDEIDIGMMTHPHQYTVTGGKSRAIESLQIEFFGKTSHAGASPEEGINALDAAVHCYSLINFEKQYFKDANVYGIFLNAGETSNIIPDYASLTFLNRAWSVEELEELKDLVTRCAKAAAIATGCEYKIFNNEMTNKEMISNQILTREFDKNLIELGEVDIVHEDISGSTDMADVSHKIPSIHPWCSLWYSDSALHTRGFTDATVTKNGDRFIELYGKALAYTGYDLLSNIKLVEDIKAEFKDTMENK